MVDPLGKTPPAKSDRIAAVARPAPIAAATPVPEHATETVARSPLAGIARDYAAKPPIDQERVARIRKAIADGSFPIYPATVADRLIALKMEWNPDESRS